MDLFNYVLIFVVFISNYVDGNVSSVFNSSNGSRDVLRLKPEQSKLKTEQAEQWLLCSDTSTLIGIGKTHIFVHGSNESSEEFEGFITAAAVNANNLIIATENGNKNLLFSYKVLNNTFIIQSKEELEYSVDYLAAWRNILIVISDGKLDLYRKNDFSMIDSTHLSENVNDLKVIVKDDFLIVTVVFDSEIITYKVKINQGELQRMSSISSENPKSVELFRLGMNTFLAIAGPNASLWKLNGNTFQFTSNFENVQKFLAIPLNTYRHDILLLAQNDESLLVFEPNGFTHLALIGNLSTLCQNCGEVDLSKSIAGTDSVFLSTQTGEVFSIDIRPELEEMPDKSEVILRELEDLRANFTNLFEAQNEKAKTLLSTLTPGINLNESNTIEAEWIVDDLEITEGSFVGDDDKEFQVDHLIFAGRHDWTEEDAKINISLLKQDAKKLLDSVNLLRDQFHAQSFHNENSVADFLPSFIETGLSVEGEVFVENLKVTKLNGDNADEWLTDCFRLDQRNIISGTKIVPSLKATNIIADSLSGIPAADLVYTDSNGPIILNGDLILESAVSIANDVLLDPSGTVNGLNLMNDLFLVDIPFKGNVELDSVNVKAARIIEMSVNNNSILLPVHMSLKDIKLENYQQIRIDQLNVANDLNVTEINGVKIDQILPKIAKNDLSLKSLSVEYINRKKFPEDFLTTTDTSPKLIGGVKKFRSLAVGNLETGLQVFLDLLQINPIIRSKDNPIEYIFNDIELLQPLETKSVNNRTLSELFKQPCDETSNSIDYGLDIDWNNIQTDFLKIYGSAATMNGEFSGYPLEQYENYLSKTKGREIPAGIIKNVENIIAQAPRKMAKMRILNVTGELSVHNVTFMDAIDAENVTVDGLVCGVNLDQVISDAVLKTDESVFIKGRKTFETLTTDHVNVFAINDWRLDELATRQGQHEFEGPVVLKGRIHVRGDFNALSHFNGINLTHLSDRVSTTYGAFLVPGNLSLAPHTHVKTLLVDGLVQGRNFTTFLNQTISRNKPAKLDGQFQLNDVIIRGDLFIPGTLNQHNITELFEDIVLLNRSADIQGLVLAAGGAISNLIVEEELTVPLVDGCDVNRWREDAISLDSDSYVHVPIHISKLSAAGDATVDFLNNKSLRSLIPLGSSQLIAATLFFEEVAVENNVNVNHLVNGLYLPEVWENCLRNNASQTLTGRTFFKSLFIDGSINTEKISNRSISTFLTTYTNQTISNNITFTGPVSIQALNTTLTDIDLNAWENTALLTTASQNLNTSWTVIGNVKAENILGSGFVQNRHLPNISERFNQKLNQAEEYNRNLEKTYKQHCESILSSAAKTKTQLRVLDMFDDIQDVEFSNTIHSAIHFTYNKHFFLLITFTGRCAAVLYTWNTTEAKFIKKSRLKLGSVDSWAVLTKSDSQLLIMSGKSCDKSKPPIGGIWALKNNSNLVLLSPFDAFTDIHLDSERIHTITKNGSISTWSFVNNTVRNHGVKHLGGKLKFVPIDLGFGLSVWDGERILNVANLHNIAASRLPAEHVAVAPSSGLVAMSDGLGVVELFKSPPDGELIDSLHFLLPTDLCWVDLKTPGELYLVFASDHHKIYIFQYKGVAGLVKRSTLPYPSSKLSVIDLPNNHTTPTPHLLVINNKTLRVLQVRMFGQPELNLNLDC